MEAETCAPMRSQSRLGAPRRLGWNRLFRPLFGARAPLRAEEVSPPPPLSEPEAAPGPRADESSPPLQFESFSREWQNLAGQDNFDGFRLEAANQVTKQMQAAHTLFLGTQLRETGYIYQFGPAFQSEDGRTVLVARTGLDGGVNGRWIQKIGSGIEMKSSANSHLKDAQRNQYDTSLEYTGGDWTGSGKLIWQGALVMTGAFSQRIVPSLQAGGDITVVPTNGVTIGTVGARYASGKDIFTATLGRTPDAKSPIATMHQLSLQYVRRLNERLTLGTEFKYSHPDQESGMNVSYEYAFRQARVQGSLDSEGKVSCCVSDFTGFGFSGVIDYVRSDYKFGVVMHVLPQPEQGQQPM